MSLNSYFLFLIVIIDTKKCASIHGEFPLTDCSISVRWIMLDAAFNYTKMLDRKELIMGFCQIEMYPVDGLIWIINGPTKQPVLEIFKASKDFFCDQGFGRSLSSIGFDKLLLRNIEVSLTVKENESDFTVFVARSPDARISGSSEEVAKQIGLILIESDPELSPSLHKIYPWGRLEVGIEWRDRFLGAKFLFEKTDE